MSTVEKAAERLRALQAGSVRAADARDGEAKPAPADPMPAPPYRLQVDRAVLRHAGLLPGDSAAAALLVDELRRIKRPLLDNVNGKGAKSVAHSGRIIVTSAVPNEGKTFTAVNLAMSLANERDFEVLLVDGDVPKSDITRVFGLDGQPGLMDLLTDASGRPADLIVPSSVPNLMLLPAGNRHANATELFGSRRMQHVLGELDAGHPHRLVLFDSAPLLATPESEVLASHMGQVVMVVAAGRTTRQEVAAALKHLDGTRYIGLVLNKSRLPSSESPYGGYYGYRNPQSAEGA